MADERDMLRAFNRGIDGIVRAITPEEDDCECYVRRPRRRYTYREQWEDAGNFERLCMIVETAFGLFLFSIAAFVVLSILFVVLIK
jgi:hypothetical protein